MPPVLRHLAWILLSSLWLHSAAAQEAPDYTQWQNTALRAEEAVENGRASDGAFEGLRAEIVGWRSQFQAAQNANASRIETLANQLSALGPVPEDGQEAAEISARRAELTQQITRLQTPRLTAEEAFTRADGIVTEIDAILRERQADALLRLGPSPLNPAHWGAALGDLGRSSANLVDEIAENAGTATVRTRTQDRLPLILVLISLAVVMVLRARTWIEALVRRIGARSDAGSDLVASVVSLGQIFVPVLGLVAFANALNLTGVMGERWSMVVDLLPLAGFAVFFARWLGTRLFPAQEAPGELLSLPEDRRAEARLYATFLGLLVGFSLLLSGIGDVRDFEETTRVTLNFPVLLLSGLVLFRLGQILRGQAPAVSEEGAPEVTFADRFIKLIGRLTMLLAIVGPILAAIGYSGAAQALLPPAIASLALLGVLAVMQQIIRDAYSLITGRERSQEALIPVLLGFALVLASFPVLALIWGARVTDLTELWTRAKTGITLGETTISPGSLLMLVLIFGIGYMITRLVQGAMRSSVLPRTRIDIGGQTAIVSGLGYIGIFIAALAAISAAGLDLSSLAIVAGALSVGIGFGLQTIVSNFVSGIILLIERPISEGDWIEVGGQMGYVRDISVRATRIETFDRSDVIIPNSDLVAGTVTNYTRGNNVGRVIVPVGVAYGTDTRRVEKILSDIAHDHPMVMLKPPPSVVMQGFGADSLDFEIRAILRDVNWVLSVKSDMNHAIAKKFAEEGIEIPFAQRDIWLRNPETIGQGGKPQSDPKPPASEEPET